MLVQIDGSHYHWLENRSESILLLATTDDATGKIVAALFRPQEDTEGYLRLTEQMIRQEGIPMSIPSDRHMIFRSPNDKQTLKQELEGEPVPLSQFGQALHELGIAHIHAHTPQAKGRIERLFQTLQDRWVVDLRIRGVSTINEANRVFGQDVQSGLCQQANHPAQNTRGGQENTRCPAVCLPQGVSLSPAGNGKAAACA